MYLCFSHALSGELAVLDSEHDDTYTSALYSMHYIMNTYVYLCLSQALSGELAVFDSERDDALGREDDMQLARHEIENLQDQLYSLQVRCEEDL